jgi:hypothetical protein
MTFGPRQTSSRPGRAGLAGKEPVHHVAVGQSLSRCRDALQQRLGPNWRVCDLISDDPLSSPGAVFVLGTAELPPGNIQLGRSATNSSVLIGTDPVGLINHGETDPSRASLDRLADLVRTLAGQPAGRDAEPLGGQTPHRSRKRAGGFRNIADTTGLALTHPRY